MKAIWLMTTPREHDYMIKNQGRMSWKRHTILNPLKMPTYEQLVDMTNGELIKRIQLALDQLVELANQGESTIASTKVYQAYEGERLKRLKVAHKKL